MISWEYFQGLGDGEDAAEGERRGLSAGKVALTQRVPAHHRPAAGCDAAALPAANDVPAGYLAQTPVQLAAAGPAHEDPFAMHLIAARGVESSGTPLPHLDKIQAAFGPAHDISSVQAHVGGAAGQAAAAIGAHAYATGEHVAFASEPDLRTAAHEAAHTVQQRGGVQLLGGVGAMGDAYEQHADAVADKVVAGESAASLLDAMTGGHGGSVQRQAIQRAPAAVGVPVRPDDDASRAYERYLGAHWEQLREAVRRHFVNHLEHWNVARLAWAVDGERRGGAIADAIFPTLHITGQLESLVAPEPLGPAIALGMATMQRPGEGDGDASWNPAVGTAVARLLERRLAESMTRMGERYVKAYDRNGGSVKAADLPRGDAMDGVAAALLGDGLVRVMGPLPAPSRERGPKKPKGWRWLGARDASLWNWIEVTDPADAELEDVALLLPPDVPPVVEGDGRFFRMPEDWARTQPGAAEHEPKDGGGATGVELASSTFALDAAIAQADDLPKARKRESASDVDARVERIFGAIHQVVAMLGDEYAARVVPAFVALVAARDRASERGQRADIARVLAGQEALLAEILEEIDLFHRTSFGRGRSTSAGPMAAVYIELALAAGNSHLHDVGRRHLATARAKSADVGRRLAEEAVAANAAGAKRVAEGDGAGVDGARERQRDRFDRLDSKAADPGSMEVEASLDAFLLHTQAVEEQLDRMVSALYATNDRLASIVGMPWVAEAEALAHSVVVVRDKARHVRGWLLERLAETPDASARRTLLERAQAALAEQITASELVDISRRVVAMLRRVDEADQIIQLVNQTVTMIGISVIASGAGMSVAAALTPTSASAAGAGVTLGRVGAAAAGMVTEAVVGGWLQSELLGDNAGEAMAENMIASLLAVGALRGFHGVTQRFGPFTAENIALWERLGGKGTGAVLRTTHLTVEMALGAGAGYAAQNIVRSPVKPTDDEALQWAMQGASIVVGHWITRRMADAHARLETARARVPADAVPRLEQTLKDIDALRARAAEAADKPMDEPAMRELFAEQHRVLAAEDAIAGGAGEVSAAGAAHGPGAGTGAPPSGSAKVTLAGATPEDLANIDRVLALDEAEGRRLVAEYGADLTEYLKFNPLPRNIEALGKTLAKERASIRGRVEGFFEGVDTGKAPEGWTFIDTITVDGWGTKILKTHVKGPNGAEGYFERGFDPATKEVELRMAFLKLSGKDVALPGMIAKQGASVEMIRGVGSPTVQYITIYQLKKLGVPLGHGAESGVEKIHMSNIQNVETIVHLHWLTKNARGDVSALAAQTASVKYAETTAIQSGYQRVGEPLVTGGQVAPIRSLLEFQEKGSVERMKENDAILARYGFGRDTEMYMNFDIDLPVRSLP